MSHPVETAPQLPVLNKAETKESSSLDNEREKYEEDKKSVSEVFVNVERVGNDGIYDIKVSRCSFARSQHFN